MKLFNYLLGAFGFIDWIDLKMSSFGFMVSLKVIKLSAILGFISTVINEMFGISHLFFLAYFILIIFEWFTGIRASLKRNEKHESRKLGRMLLKIGIYLVPLYVLNIFQQEVNFPVVLGYEIDPFVWLYWTVLLVIIWQLVVSLLENLKDMDIKYASVLLKIINRKFYKKFDLEEDEKTDKKNI